jgi:hypothetical protein
MFPALRMKLCISLMILVYYTLHHFNELGKVYELLVMQEVIE